MRNLSCGIVCTFIVFFLMLTIHPTPNAEAATATEIDTRTNAVLSSFYDKTSEGKELAAKAAGILVFPSIVKAGMVVGGEYGEGALRVGGTTVGYYSTASGSIGLQLGVQSKSLIIMFMDKKALDSFKVSDGWEVGVDASIALVTVGVDGSINTNTVQQPVIGFVFNQKGFMGNLTLEGTKISKIVR